VLSIPYPQKIIKEPYDINNLFLDFSELFKAIFELFRAFLCFFEQFFKHINKLCKIIILYKMKETTDLFTDKTRTIHQVNKIKFDLNPLNYRCFISHS